MADSSKKFYWIKLKDSFMTGDVIDFLLSQKGGSDYVVIYLLLCLKAVNTDGKLETQIREVIVPYDVSKIQRELKHFGVSQIILALELYCKLGLVYKNQDDVFVIADFESMVGGETGKAELMRSLRKKRTSGNNVTQESKRVRDKEIRDKEIRESEKTHTKKHGEFSNIMLTVTQYDWLFNKFSESELNTAIEQMSSWLKANGRTYNDYQAALNRWITNNRSSVTNKQVQKKGRTISEVMEVLDYGD